MSWSFSDGIALKLLAPLRGLEDPAPGARARGWDTKPGSSTFCIPSLIILENIKSPRKEQGIEKTQSLHAHSLSMISWRRVAQYGDLDMFLFRTGTL